MMSKFNGSVHPEKPPLVVEIIGPAGAGKTTLLKALGERQNNIQEGLHLPNIRKIPFLINITFFFLPLFLLRYRQSRWFNWRETRSMVYLKAGLYVLEHQESNNNRVIILDHGPIYRLALLRELGDRITTSKLYKNWWTNLLKQWIATIDVIIWLDAPDGILVKRIRTRNKSHTVKKTSKKEAYKYLTHYRKFLEKLISESVNDHQITYLRFDTNKTSLEEIINTVLATFNTSQNINKVDLEHF